MQKSEHTQEHGDFIDNHQKIKEYLFSLVERDQVELLHQWITKGDLPYEEGMKLRLKVEVKIRTSLVG